MELVEQTPSLLKTKGGGKGRAGLKETTDIKM